METNKNKFPGFIDGLKASNISLNKTSLDEFSQQILIKIVYLYSNFELPKILKENCTRSKDALEKSLQNESTNEVINYYIKFGDIFVSIIPELKLHIDSKEFKDIAINYLQIAKYSSDSRIKDLSISIAKNFD